MEYGLVGWWLLAFAAISAFAFPLTARLFRSFPGRGAGFAPTVALCWFVVIGYWVGHVGFGRPTLWVALIVIVGASALIGLDRTAVRSHGRLRLAGRTEPVDRSSVIASGIIFIGAFLLIAAIRSADPAVTATAGEKFLDYSLLRAVLRADAVPIYDVWFAGETLNYYYGGHLAAGLLTMFTGTDPAYAYNLALAGFYACLVTGAFELARAIAAGRVRDRNDVDTIHNSHVADSEKTTELAIVAHARAHGFRAGLAAAVFVGLAANLVTIVQLIVGALPGRAGEWVAETAAAGRVSAADLRAGVDGFFYWDASRVIDGTINEFPLFAFLNGDLHAHMMGAPFLLLAAAVAYAYWQTPAAEFRRRRALVFAVMPVIGGTQILIHTWDFPTVFGVLWVSLTFAPATPITLLPGGGSVLTVYRNRFESTPFASEIERTGGALVITSVAAVIGFVIGAPFFFGATTGQEPALVAASDRSGLIELFLVHGLFVAGFGTYLIGRIVGSGESLSARTETDRSRALTDDRIHALTDDRSRSLSDFLPLAIGVGAIVAVAGLTGFHVVAIVVPMLALGWAALRLGRDVGFETVLLIGGAGLVGLVELVYVVEAAGPGRLNTVFKVYFQVWVLWGVALGVVLAELWDGGFTGRGTTIVRRRVIGALDRLAPDGSDIVSIGVADRLPDGTTVARLFVLMLIVCAVPYAGLALAEHFERYDAGTLDATAFASTDHPDEAAAIAWLDETATHEETLLEAPGASRSPDGLATDPTMPGMYTWRANPASSLTGVPTVAGWAHQVGYRGEAIYYDRVADVDRAYAGSTADRTSVLDKYDVTYVWVGPTETARYDADVSFETHGSVVFENDAVRIYRID